MGSWVACVCKYLELIQPDLRRNSFQTVFIKVSYFYRLFRKRYYLEVKVVESVRKEYHS